eukprot:s1614_g3.t1
MLFNHFQRNRELTTKVGLTNNLRRFNCEGLVDVDRFFPRSYDMSSASEVQDFVLDFRRCAALGVLRQHLRLANWAEERRRMMEHMNMDGVVDGSCYVCNVNVLRIAVKAMLHWLEDLDGTFFEDEDQRQGARPHLFTQEWDALVCYSDLTDAELCGEDDGEERKRKQRGSYSASGMVIPTSGTPTSRASRAENHQRWPEFYQHHWGEPPENLRQHAEETLKLLEARWPQISAQGPMNVWVVKPGSSSKGSGVLCMDSLPEVLHHCKTTSNRIVQKYIERPLLLFSGRKFDLRQWVMVRSFRPLKVYMFSSRLCNAPYDLGDLENRQRHISNWSVNKRGKHVSDGAVASLDEFQEVLEMMTGHRSYWEEELIPQLKTCIIQTLHAVQPNIIQRSESFEVYGFDFLIGEDLKPWLLEVNLSPACESRTAWMSEMLERMASRLVEVLLQGDAFTPDGREPDWQLICDEGPDRDANPATSPAMSPVAAYGEEAPPCRAREGAASELADTWGQRALNLTVLGKSVSRRFLRRLDQIWRRNEAQKLIAARWRGWVLRQRMREERWRMAGVVFHRCRQRAWLNLLRLALFQRRKGPAAKLISTVTRCFLCQRELQEVRRRKEALRIQTFWRGHRGRRRAAALRRRSAVARLQRWWRSAQLRRRLVAKGRILRWWRRLHGLRRRAVLRLQAVVRQRVAARRYTLLSQHVARPTRKLALLMAAVRWRWWRIHCEVSDSAVRLQRCFRGFLGRRSAKERRLLRETFGNWRMQAAPLRLARLRLQRCWRGLRDRRRCAARRQALCKLQSALRRRLCCKQRRWRRAAILVQRRFRGFRCSKRFQHSIRMIMVIQRGVRCWLSRRRLAMLQRFAARRRKWLNQDPEPKSPRLSTAEVFVGLKLDEDATTQSSTPTWPESEAPDASFSARSAADEMDISIGLIEVPEPEERLGPRSGPGGIGDETFLMAQNLVEAQMLREQRLAGGFRDEDDTSQPEAPTELPLLQHLQDMARTFDALMAGVSASTRCLVPTAAPVAPVETPDLITGSALRAARRLRQQGYAKPTISSTRRPHVPSFRSLLCPATQRLMHAALNLWRWEPSREGVVLRVIAGEMCGALLSLRGAERHENSVYAMVHMDPSLATIFQLQPVKLDQKGAPVPKPAERKPTRELTNPKAKTSEKERALQDELNKVRNELAKLQESFKESEIQVRRLDAAEKSVREQLERSEEQRSNAARKATAQSKAQEEELRLLQQQLEEKDRAMDQLKALGSMEEKSQMEALAQRTTELSEAKASIAELTSQLAKFKEELSSSQQQLKEAEEMRLVAEALAKEAKSKAPQVVEVKEDKSEALAEELVPTFDPPVGMGGSGWALEMHHVLAMAHGDIHGDFMELSW